MDVLKVGVKPGIPSGYEVVIHGGRKPMGIDALEWAQRAQELGAGEICLNSIDADGTQDGYELTLTSMISDAVSIPVIASGGAGEPQHLADVLDQRARPRRADRLHDPLRQLHHPPNQGLSGGQGHQGSLLLVAAAITLIAKRGLCICFHPAACSSLKTCTTRFSLPA
jgi:hypothetical protein